MSSDKALEQIVDESVYWAVCKEAPLLVEEITVLLQVGATPSDIECKLRRIFGNTQMVRNVRHVANYLIAQSK